MSLPYFQTDTQELSLLQTKWKSQLDPLLSNPMASGIFLKNIVLVSGANVVNHLLQRKLQGWFVVRMRTNFAQIYDTQDTNTMPSLTLNLNASAGVTVDLFVF